jgi:hypothetical protein
MIIDGIEKEQTLFSLVKDTLKLSKSMENGTNNSIIAFHDNSSVSLDSSMCCLLISFFLRLFVDFKSPL